MGELIRLNITTQTTTPGNLRRVRKWGDPVMKLYGFDTEQAGTSNFQAVGLYNKQTNTFGAISNFVRITNSDVIKLRDMQVPDAFTREQKMNWLVSSGDRGVRIYWGGEWRTSNEIEWGTLALGGNLVQVESYETIYAPDPIGSGRRNLNFAKLVGFKKSDWVRPLQELVSQGLVHRAYCANRGSGENIFADSPKGICWTPFYDPRDWRSGSVRDSALYILEDWLE